MDSISAQRPLSQPAEHALDALANTVDNAGSAVAPKLVRMAEQAEALAHRSADALRDGSHQLREKTEQASQQTLQYIRDEPVRSVLIAAAAGATLMALLALFGRSRRSH